MINSKPFFFPTELVGRITSLNGIYLKAFQNYYEYNIENGNYKLNKLNIYLQPLAILYLAITATIYMIIRSKRNQITKDNSIKFVFVSAFDHVFRSKQLYQVAEESSFNVLYLPGLDLASIKRHMSNSYQRNNAVFERFSLRDLFRFILIIASRFKLLYKLAKCGDLTIENKRFLFKIIFQFLLLDAFSKSFIKKLNVTTSTKWLFDYDRGYMLPLIMRLQQRGTHTYHLQHGIMQQPNKFYIPCVCNYAICCSERERKHYINSGMKSDTVFVLGAPLQSINFYNIQNEIGNKKSKIDYDIIVLLTDTSNELVYSLQKELLLELDALASSYKILCRYRPASMKKDAVKLEKWTCSFTISELPSLTEDIHRAKMVVSFSFDAVFEAIVKSKALVLVVDPSHIDEDLKSICKLEVKEAISEIMIYLKKDQKIDKEKYDHLLGDPDPSKIISKFNEIVTGKIIN